MTTVDPRRSTSAPRTTTPEPMAGIRPHHRVFRVPGVYPVQRDTSTVNAGPSGGSARCWG